MNVAEALEAGARRLETHGWATGNGWLAFADGDPSPTCAGNAIALTTSVGGIHAQHQFAHYLSGGLDISPNVIFRWNDAPGQTKENVIATMRACAAIWRAKNSRSDAPALGVESEPAQECKPAIYMGITGTQGAPIHA